MKAAPQSASAVRNRHDALTVVVGVLQGRVLVPGETPELRTGGVQHDQVLQPADHAAAGFLVVGHRGGAGVLARAGERVATGTERSPRVLLDGDPGPRDRFLAAGVVRGQLQRERLRLDAPELPGHRVHGVLLGVGRQRMRVVAAQMDCGQIAGQAGGHVPVPHQIGAVRPGPSAYVDDPYFRLAVPVRAELHHDRPPPQLRLRVNVTAVRYTMISPCYSSISKCLRPIRPRPESPGRSGRWPRPARRPVPPGRR